MSIGGWAIQPVLWQEMDLFAACEHHFLRHNRFPYYLCSDHANRAVYCGFHGLHNRALCLVTKIMYLKNLTMLGF